MKKCAFLSLSCLLLAALALPALAAPGDIIVGGEFLIRVRTPAPSGGSVLDRAGTINSRMVGLLGSDSLGPIMVDQVNGQWCVRSRASQREIGRILHGIQAAALLLMD